MDRFIAQCATLDDDLIVCPLHGVAFQADMTVTAEYDEDYYNKCASYEGAEIARKINAGRVALVNKYYEGSALDIGIGSGEFIKSRPNTYGYDINPAAERWLKSFGLWAQEFSDFHAFTLWDVIEHVPEPEDYFSRMPQGSFLFTSIPIFKDLFRIRESRHYRPGEHLYYWTESGFRSWMFYHGFTLLERQTFEMDAGRDSIYSFAFKKEKT